MGGKKEKSKIFVEKEMKVGQKICCFRRVYTYKFNL